MSLGSILLLLLAFGAVGFLLGRQKALASVGGDARRLHSLPGYHGWTAALGAVLPALAVLVVWMIAQPILVERSVSGMILPGDIADGSSRELVMTDVRRIAAGIAALDAAGQNGVGLAADPAMLKTALQGVGVALAAPIIPHVAEAAVAYGKAMATGRAAMTAAVLALTVLGMGAALWRIGPTFRARNVVEGVTRLLLISASLVAILTTVGIIFSLVFESIHFFRIYPAAEFFLSTVWAPKFGGGSQLGLWPLVWGTLYVSVIALVVAVPVGLMAAVYLSEYAGPKLRATAKPALEVLAGIPSIVYGLFALLTVGPFLRDWFAEPLGLGNSSSSVMTAGVVMGIMLIPYVSSLSDDIINAVPQALRDGSYGLGATQSETIRQVVLPAALPGIVGAVLMAASRAIGETMIVVLGAGAAAKLSMNPFEAMTTVTVKIVSQLTGDNEFLSAETLVAFALGLTLFVFTLGLNILALYIVRKYREQYE